MELAVLRFLVSMPAALAVGLLLLPRLTQEDGKRFRPAIAVLALARALLGLLLIVGIARSIIPPSRSLDLPTLVDFSLGTVVGKSWLATQALVVVFAFVAAARLIRQDVWIERLALGLGFGVVAVASVTGHAIDDSLPFYTKLSFPLHTVAGLTWFGGLLGLVYWMITGRDQPPAVARRLAERWSLVAKIAIGVVFVSGVALAWENVASFPNLLATPYGRLLTLKLAFLCSVLLLALSLARYLTRASESEFDIAWYGRVGALEAASGAALLFVAGWIAVITPAAHENDLFWPLPFRISYVATWGQKVPMWSDIWWWGVATLALAAATAFAWWAPRLHDRRRVIAPCAALAAFVCLIISLSVQAYPDTYNDSAVPYTAESISRGHAAFRENCVACHGATGDGRGPMAKDLKVPPADLTAPHVGTHTLGDIFHWLTFGGQSGVMPAFGNLLEQDDRWDVINYLLVLSSTNQSRFLGPKGVIQWLVAPDFSLADPEEKVTSLEGLRGAPVVISFADCRARSANLASLQPPNETSQLGSEESAALSASLQIASETARAEGARHVTVYKGKCRADPVALSPTHPDAVEVAYSVLNHYLDEPTSMEIPEGHFLVDRSGYIRARYRHFSADDGSIAPLKAQITLTASEPVVQINLHSH